MLKLLGTGTVVATAAAWYMLKGPEPFNPNFDFSNQSRKATVSVTSHCSSFRLLYVWKLIFASIHEYVASTILSSQ